MPPLPLPPPDPLAQALVVLGGGDPALVCRGGGTSAPWRYALVPSARNPRALLPLDASAACLRTALAPYAEGAAAPAMRVAARMLQALSRLGLAAPLLRHRLTVGPALPGSALPLHDYLADVLGTRRFVTALRLAPDRPNGKPVVQVSDPQGRPLAYAKFGWEPLTRRLIAAEAAMLATLAPAVAGSPVTVPAVLAAGPWNGLQALVVAPLPAGGRAPARLADIPPEALSALVCALPPRQLRLGQSPFWHRERRRIGTLADHLSAAGAATLTDAARVVEERWGDEPLVFGLGHGDWIPPNMRVQRGGRLVVWDWERAAGDAPLGRDLLQFLQFDQHRRDARPGPRGTRRLQAEAAATLAAQGLEPAHAPLLAILSLIETVLWFAEAREADRAQTEDAGYLALLRHAVDTVA
ncbi:hypothetical protein [Caenispirillum bisanense]|uniref:Phosphotransferase enzyme family protein n=1 Tax=Caenispirillum bisanense TaxID=414052 RepID=A0A286GDY1_9PROT|nr:hypothetical protein [Caenispirillum bisanense]SOD93446.1 hypothetical protein SAMN05421508_10372 [Caenispirillum bisanense]